jgi:hypothetical protein
MQSEQKKLMKQVWLLDPFHKGFYNTKENTDPKEFAFSGLEISENYP